MTETKALVKSKETPKQRGAFLMYFDLGDERSIRKLKQELVRSKAKVSLTTLFTWSKKFQWQDRVVAMDTEVAEKAEQVAIKNATLKKSLILVTVKNTMIKYNQALLAGDVVPTARDFKQMWEIQRTERGLDKEEAEKPSLIKIEINQRILNIIIKAEQDARKVIAQEIEDE